jgi:protein-disulfide isomerase
MNLATVVLVGCALTVTGLLIRRELRPAPIRNGVTAPRIQKDWQDYAASGHVLGRGGARVTIIEFADFECPVCRRFASYVDSLRFLGKDFKVVYRHFPLPMHRFAIPAVRASECADEQGHFEKTHDTIYKYADSLGLVSWWWFAHKGGVPDSARFAQCMLSSLPLVALARDTVDGNRLGIRGTPTLFIGPLRLEGLYPFDSIRAYIDRAAARNQ